MHPCPTQREAAGDEVAALRSGHTHPCAPSLPDAAPQGASRCGRADINRYSAADVGCISLHIGTAELASCYGSVQKVSETSVMPPAPPTSGGRGHPRGCALQQPHYCPLLPLVAHAAPKGASPCGIASRWSAMPNWLPAMARYLRK